MSPDRLWLFLEARPSAAAVMAEWRERCGEQMAAIQPLLQPTQAPATAHPALVPGRPPLRIVRHGDGLIVGVCDEGMSERVVLTPADIVLHTIDLAALRRLLCGALGLGVSREAIGRLPGLLRIGQWRPKPAASFPVSLAVGATAEHLVELVVGAAATNEGPALLLTPTRVKWTDRAEEVASSARIALVPLDDVITITDGGWAAGDAWDQHKGAFVARAGISMAPGFSTLRKKTRIAKASGTTGKIKVEVRKWYRSARARLIDAGELLPPPPLKVIAGACGVSESTVSRCVSGKGGNPDRELTVLWSGVTDHDAVRKYRDP